MKKHSLFTFTISALSMFLLVTAPVAAATHGGGPNSTPTGNDVSWPQCSSLSSLPTSQAFGIVGVNDGVANSTNPCFSQELAWAASSSGVTTQPKAALYVNTANPGDVTPTVSDWPTNNVDVLTGALDNDPYGSCTGADDLACSWQYGFNKANEDVNSRGVSNPSTYRWWLDVETANSWTNSTAKNAADLEGMVDYFSGVTGSANLGIYSTSYQLGTIIGTNYSTTPDAGGNVLNGLESWIPGARTLKGAESNCSLASLTLNGKVSVTQYTTKQLDYDYSCI